MALYLKKLAIRNFISEEVTQLVNVMEGAEGSAVFGYNVTDSALVTSNGQKTQYKQTHTVSLSVLPSTGAEETAMNTIMFTPNSNPVQIAGMSDDIFLTWDDPVYMTQKDEFGDTLTRNLLMTLDATIGYRGTAPLKKKPVYSGGNLLALYDILSGSASVLNGFTVAGTMTTSVSGAIQTLTRGADATALLESRPIFFPFAGESITLSMFVNSANAAYTFGFKFLDENGAEIGVDASIPTTGATSRKSHTATIPTGTAFVVARFVPGASVGNNLVFQNPAVRLSGLTAFTN